MQRLRKSYVIRSDRFLASSNARYATTLHAARWRVRLQKKFCLYISVFLLFLCSGSALTFAQETPASAMEYQIKAAFLYKFCLYIEWPPTAFANSNSPFVFGIAAPANFITELNAVVKDHTINDRPVQIRRIDNGDLNGVHVLFIARSQQSLLPQLRAQARSLPLLMVTESEHGLDDGGTINFSLKNNRISFDVALDMANRQGLHLSAQLLKVASNVRSEGTP